MEIHLPIIRRQKEEVSKNPIHLAAIVRRKVIHHKCWRRPDVFCSKCNQLGHEVVICKAKDQVKEVDAQVVDQEEEEEDQLFMVTSSSGKESSESSLIDSGCTNHMTYDKESFEELRDIEDKRVMIGNGEHLEVKGKGTVAITSYEGPKFISDVLFVPKIDQNIFKCWSIT